MTINILEGGSRLVAVLCFLWVFGASYLTGFPVVKMSYDILSPTLYSFYPRGPDTECPAETGRSESFGFTFVEFRPVVIDLCFLTFEDPTKGGQVLYWTEEKGDHDRIWARHGLAQTTLVFSSTANAYVHTFKALFAPVMNAEMHKYWRFAMSKLGISFLLYLVVGWVAILMAGGTFAWIVSGFLRKPSE